MGGKLTLTKAIPVRATTAPCGRCPLLPKRILKHIAEKVRQRTSRRRGPLRDSQFSSVSERRCYVVTPK